MTRTTRFSRSRTVVGVGGLALALLWPVLPASAATAPAITGVAPSPTHVGRTVTVTGSGLTGATAVTLGSLATTYTVLDDAHLSAVVPAGATSAPVHVTTPDGEAVSPADLVVSAAPAAVTALKGVVTDHAALLTWTGGAAVVRDVTGLTGTRTPTSGRAVASTPGLARDLSFTNRAARTYDVWAVAPDGATSDTAATTTVVPVAALATTTSLAALTPKVVYGNRLTLTGTVTRLGLAVPGATLQVLGRTGGTGTARQIGSIRTGSDGRATYTSVPRTTTEYQLRYAGDAFSTASASERRGSAVQPRLTARLDPALLLQGQTTHLRGVLAPNYAGARVQLQRQVGSAWRSISVTTAAGNGSYDVTFTPPPGTYVLRALLPASTSHLAVASATQVLRVDARDLVDGDRGGDVLALERRLAGLHYDVGSVNGVYDYDLHHAVLAFQKVERLRRTGHWGSAERTRLAHPTTWTLQRSTRRTGRAVEVDVTRQVLVLVQDGRVQRLLDVSSGSEQLYSQDGQTNRAHTPRGVYSITRKIDDPNHQSALGTLYRPAYFFQGWAIHGNGSVPAYPASHGCVRITDPAMDRLYDLLVIGTQVNVYDE